MTKLEWYAAKVPELNQKQRGLWRESFGEKGGRRVYSRRLRRQQRGARSLQTMLGREQSSFVQGLNLQQNESSSCSRIICRRLQQVSAYLDGGVVTVQDSRVEISLDADVFACSSRKQTTHNAV